MLRNATRFRRITAGLCLIAAPILSLISDMLQVRDPSLSIPELLDAVAANPVPNEIAFIFALAGFVLMVPAVVGIVHLLRHRSVALGHIGGALTIVGLFSFAFVGGTEFLLFGPGADPSLNRAAILALNERISVSPVYTLINLAEIFGIIFGFIILAIALFRAQAKLRLAAVLLGISTLSRFLLASFSWGVIASDILLAIASAAIGYFVLRLSDDEWERLSVHERTA